MSHFQPIFNRRFSRKQQPLCDLQTMLRQNHSERREPEEPAAPMCDLSCEDPETEAVVQQ